MLKAIAQYAQAILEAVNQTRITRKHDRSWEHYLETSAYTAYAPIKTDIFLN